MYVCMYVCMYVWSVFTDIVDSNMDTVDYEYGHNAKAKDEDEARARDSADERGC